MADDAVAGGTVGSAAQRFGHHTASGFRNPPGSPHHSRDPAAMRRFVLRQLLGRHRPVLPFGHVLPADLALAGWQAADPADRVMWLGHAGFLLALAGATVLLDPFLSPRASPFRLFGPKRYAPPPLTAQQLPPVDLLVLSHSHYDHLDLPALRRLPHRHRITAVVPLRVGRLLAGLGFHRVIELDWTESVQAGPVTVTAVPAVHFSARSPFDRNRTLWAGFVLKTAGQRLYFAGDTAYGPVFADAIGPLGPFDLALLPIGAYEPRDLMATHHICPEEAVRIAGDVGAQRVLGMHWGTVRLTEEDPFEPPARFRAAMARAGFADSAVWLPAIGETRPLLPPG